MTLIQDSVPFYTIEAQSKILVGTPENAFFGAGHYQPTSETPLKWRFAGGPILARDFMIAGMFKFYVIVQWKSIYI